MATVFPLYPKIFWGRAKKGVTKRGKGELWLRMIFQSFAFHFFFFSLSPFKAVVRVEVLWFYYGKEERDYLRELFSSSWREADSDMSGRASGHVSPGSDGVSCPSPSLAMAVHFLVRLAISLLDWPLTAVRRNFASLVLRSRQLRLFSGRLLPPC